MSQLARRKKKKKTPYPKSKATYQNMAQMMPPHLAT